MATALNSAAAHGCPYLTRLTSRLGPGVARSSRIGAMQRCPVTGSRALATAAAEAVPLQHPPVATDSWPQCPVVGDLPLPPQPSPHDGAFAARVDALAEAGTLRRFVPLGRTEEAHCASYRAEGHAAPITNWCANDYLGMGRHPEVVAAGVAAAERYGAGSGGTRNISGSHPLHDRLEELLAAVSHKQRALLFGSCYTANAEAIPTLVSSLPAGAVIFSDQRNHASIVRGVRMSHAEKRIFRHNDVADLRRQLAEVPVSAPKIIIFESVYSMCGSIAPMEDIVAAANDFGAITFCDEVHAVGLYGAEGGGIARQQGLSDRIDIISGTLGKAYGAYGGYIAASDAICEALRSFCPGFIFTTSLPPFVAASAAASVSLLAGDRGEELRAAHRRTVARAKAELEGAGLPLLDNPSHICPLVVGDSSICKAMAEELLAEHSIYVQPINQPSVPHGMELFRLTPSPLHSDAQVSAMVSSVSAVFSRWRSHLPPHRPAWAP